MERMIKNLLKMDKNIIKFYSIYLGVFFGILTLFFASIILWGWALKILFAVWVLISYFFLFLPCMKDFSDARSGKYCIVEGKILEENRAVESWRVIIVVSKKGECVKGINVLCKFRLNNLYGRIEYLPHTRFGRIQKIQE